MLVSAVHKSESVLHIQYFKILFPYESLQSTEQSSLCYIVVLISYLFYIQQCTYVGHSLPVSPSPPSPRSFSASVTLLLFLNRLITLDSVYKQHHMTFVPLWFISLRVPAPRVVRVATGGFVLRSD